MDWLVGLYVRVFPDLWQRATLHEERAIKHLAAARAAYKEAGDNYMVASCEKMISAVLSQMTTGVNRAVGAR